MEKKKSQKGSYEKVKSLIYTFSLRKTIKIEPWLYHSLHYVLILLFPSFLYRKKKILKTILGLLK